MNRQDLSRRVFMRTLTAGSAAMAFNYWDFKPVFGSPLQQPPAPIETRKLTGTLVMLSGDGGNVGLLLAEDSILMVDSGLAMRAADMVKVVAEWSPRKVAILFNTHFHFDHVGANEMLGKAGTKIMAHENVKKVLSSRFSDEAFGRTFEPLQREGIPVEDQHVSILELGWCCVWGIVAIQIEERRAGRVDVEDRLVLVKAYDAKDACRRLRREWIKYATPYLNPNGYLVRWQLVSVKDVYAVMEDEVDPSGCEVYSRLRSEKMKPEYCWLARGRHVQ